MREQLDGGASDSLWVLSFGQWGPRTFYDCPNRL